ncbi:NmrA/HSCARG family protein [Aspergillus stella-maris]|uniref:NmrA/HSCARG family protein n=1 Tax=Aspergillus stella-maris TaxID=1810926 RepID=UPI003CCD3644
MTERKLILVIGGTGAQGTPVVEALSSNTHYSVRLLTRDPTSSKAQSLASLPNVSIIQGSQDSQADLHAAFSGVYGAWVNLDGFTLGEKNELFYGIRAYEIAQHHGLKHYVFANSDYAAKKAGWDERYHWGHNDAKGRVGELILGLSQNPQTKWQDSKMEVTLLTTGPYMDMLFDGMFVPEEQDDGSFVWENPAADGKIPLIALDDVGIYTLWIFDHPSESSGLDLEVATDQVTFTEIAATFSKVTGKAGVHKRVSLEGYLEKAEPYPGAYSNWTVPPDVPRDESFMTWRENFTAWWRYWSEGKGATRNMAFLDEIHPERIRNLEAWMRIKGYDGRPRAVLKGLEDLKKGK